VTRNPNQRPISPFLIGPYYKPQLTSMLSIAGRLAGIFVTAVTAPAMFLYLLALASGPEAYTGYVGLLQTLPGIVVCLLSLFFLCYHLANGVRHLIWDTGRMLDLEQIYRSGYLMLICTVLLFVAVLWAVLS